MGIVFNQDGKAASGEGFNTIIGKFGRSCIKVVILVLCTSRLRGGLRWSIV
jgi:hypothetical protein